MAWNEPGNGDKDPWGQNNADQLDESLKRFKQKLMALFGVSKQASGGGDAGGTMAIGLVLSVFLIFWALSGIYIVAPAEKAVVLRFGKYLKTVEPGPHWIPRFIDSKRVVNEQRVSTHSYAAKMLTKDENIVSVDVAIQYRIDDIRAYLFQVVSPEASLQQATASALRQVIGNTTLEQVLTKGRGKVRQDVEQQLIKLLARYRTGLEVTSVALQPAKAPEEVKAAFDDAINAQEDEKRFKEQAENDAKLYQQQAIGRTQRILIEAKAYKEQVILDAKAKTARYVALLPQYNRAPKVTRDRMYLDAMSSVLEKSTKLLVDVGGSNNMFYLPLDKMVSHTQETQAVEPQYHPSKSGIAAMPYQASVDRNTRRATDRPDRSHLLQG